MRRFLFAPSNSNFFTFSICVGGGVLSAGHWGWWLFSMVIIALVQTIGEDKL